MATDNRIMDWDDVIQDDGQEFVVLPDADGCFAVSVTV